MVSSQNKKLTSSELFGTNWQNQTQFDDMPFVKGLESVKIKELSFWYTSQFLSGLQVFYHQGQKISNGWHCAIDVFKFQDKQLKKDPKGNEVKFTSLEIDHDDEIVKITVHAGAIIDGIGFTTRKGKQIHAGGSGGSVINFDLKGKTFAGFSGSVADPSQGNYYWTVHSLRLHFLE